MCIGIKLGVRMICAGEKDAGRMGSLLRVVLQKKNFWRVMRGGGNLYLLEEQVGNANWERNHSLMPDSVGGKCGEQTSTRR